MIHQLAETRAVEPLQVGIILEVQVVLAVQVILVIQTQVQQLRPLILFNLAILFGESPINSVLQWTN